MKPTSRIINGEAHLRRLREVKDIEDDVVQGLLEGGELVRQEAMASIREGTIRGPLHVPSKPGEPPKGDTGRLETNIEVQLRKSERTVNVASLAPHSFELEFGHGAIAERPFMRPALRKHKNRVVTGTVSAVNGAIARVFKGR